MPIEGVELEKKTCECGCGGTWRAMSSSPNRYSSQTHEPGFEATDVYRPAKKAGRPKKKKSDYHAETDQLPPETEELDEPVSRFVDLPTDTAVDV